MLSRDRLLNILAVLICFIAALHTAAYSFSLYWYLWWYDIILHLLGGAFSGLLIVWICYFSGYTKLTCPTSRQIVTLAFWGALFIGIGWEVFERALGHTWSPEGYFLDSGIDIVMDILGALGASLLLRLIPKRPFPQEQTLAARV